MYAGLSMRIASLLALDKPAPDSLSNVEREHRKRVWWTSYCMEISTSSELGVTPSVSSDAVSVKYPGNDMLSEEETKQFHGAEYLTAQVRLCFIKSSIVDTVSNMNCDGLGDIGKTLKPSIELLRNWKASLPPHMSFTLDDGVPEIMRGLPTMRSLASLYLRHNQVSWMHMNLYLNNSNYSLS
jgi:proline utilization trans-activator